MPVAVRKPKPKTKNEKRSARENERNKEIERAQRGKVSEGEGGKEGEGEGKGRENERRVGDDCDVGHFYERRKEGWGGVEEGEETVLGERWDGKRFGSMGGMG